MAWFFTSVTQFHSPACPSPTFLSSVTTLPPPILNALTSPRFKLQSSTPLSLSASLLSQEFPELTLHLCTPNLSQTSQHILNYLMTYFTWMYFKYCQQNISKRESFIYPVWLQQSLLECLLLLLIPLVVWSPGQCIAFPLPWLPYLISREVNPTRHPMSPHSHHLPTASYMSSEPYH